MDGSLPVEAPGKAALVERQEGISTNTDCRQTNPDGEVRLNVPDGPTEQFDPVEHNPCAVSRPNRST